MEIEIDRGNGNGRQKIEAGSVCLPLPLPSLRQLLFVLNFKSFIIVVTSTLTTCCYSILAIATDYGRTDTVLVLLTV